MGVEFKITLVTSDERPIEEMKLITGLPFVTNEQAAKVVAEILVLYKIPFPAGAKVIAKRV